MLLHLHLSQERAHTTPFPHHMQYTTMTELLPASTSAESQALLNGHRGHLHRPVVGAGQAGQQESPSSINDIWKACAYGDLDQLNTCLKQDVSQVSCFLPLCSLS